MHRCSIQIGGFAAILISVPACRMGGPLWPEERVVFFPSVGHPARDSDDCVLSIEGWLYEPYWTAAELKSFEDLPETLWQVFREPSDIQEDSLFATSRPAPQSHRQGADSCQTSR